MKIQVLPTWCADNALESFQDRLDGVSDVSASVGEGQRKGTDRRGHFMRLKYVAKKEGLSGGEIEGSSSIAGGGWRRSRNRFLNGPAEAIQRCDSDVINGPGASLAAFRRW